MEHGFPPVDPLAGLEDEHNGVPALRAARALLAQGEAERAAVTLADARRLGVPTEAEPHLLAAEGAAAVQAGRPGDALDVLVDAWRAHPDVAALPALLAIAQYAAGDSAAAARSFYAAIMGDDPDASLAAWRAVLTQLRAQLGM